MHFMVSCESSCSRTVGVTFGQKQVEEKEDKGGKNTLPFMGVICGGSLLVGAVLSILHILLLVSSSTARGLHKRRQDEK